MGLGLSGKLARLSLVLIATISMVASTNAGVILLEDDFSYPNGSLAGNALWAPHATAASLSVSAGQVVSPGTLGEYNGTHDFSHADFASEAFTFAIDVLTPTHNSVASIVLPTSFAQVGGWTYTTTGWRFGSNQTSVTSGARVEILFDPLSGMMTGRLLDLNNGTALASPINVALNNPLQENLVVNIYADSRAQIATTTFDNLSIASQSTMVPEPASFACFSAIMLMSVTVRRRKRCRRS